MGDNTKITWADHTFNPWEGCQKVSPGCDHCYAEVRNARFGGGTATNWGAGAPRRRTSASNWRKPLAWQAKAAEFLALHGRKQRVFCSSLADVFDNAVDLIWRRDLAATIVATPDLIWMLLTKRIGNAAAMLADMFPSGVPANVRLGATIVNQEEADRDIPKLLATPAAYRFLSCEPLLGPLCLDRIAYPESHYESWLDGTAWDDVNGDLTYDIFKAERGPHIDEIIVGGESGPGARPMHPDWVRSLRDQCAAAGVHFDFKQWGEWRNSYGHPSGTPGQFAMMSIEDHGWTHLNAVMLDAYPRQFNALGSVILERVGKRQAGRMLDGREHNGSREGNIDA